jgi:hypothetical protein
MDELIIVLHNIRDSGDKLYGMFDCITQMLFIDVTRSPSEIIKTLGHELMHAEQWFHGHLRPMSAVKLHRVGTGSVCMVWQNENPVLLTNPPPRDRVMDYVCWQQEYFNRPWEREAFAAQEPLRRLVERDLLPQMSEDYQKEWNKPLRIDLPPLPDPRQLGVVKKPIPRYVWSDEHGDFLTEDGKPAGAKWQPR